VGEDLFDGNFRLKTVSSRKVEVKPERINELMLGVLSVLSAEFSFEKGQEEGTAPQKGGMKGQLSKKYVLSKRPNKKQKH